MTERRKILVALVIIFFPIGALFAWVGNVDGISRAWVWLMRTVFPLGTALALLYLLRAFFRRDKAPDLLRALHARYFERNGFCFAVLPGEREGRFFLDLYFQNRFARRCLALVVIKPSEKFLLTREPIPPISVKIECEGGAFGVCRVPWSVPESLQGKLQSLDVAARAKYPDRRGKLLRFRDGITVGPPVTVSRWRYVGLITGLLRSPARAEIRLPVGTALSDADPLDTQVETLWRPGDEARIFSRFVQA
jgi:hypothetical protein